MANDTETLADVSAWCRDIARSYRNAPSNKIEIEGLNVCNYLDELANRIDAAAKREIPQPDPDWKAICEKCHDGDIEPDCEYYGEPNGCNSPIYGEHPKAQPAGNAAAIRTALKRLRDASRDFYNQILNSQYSGILDKYTCAKQGFPAVLDVRAAIPAANAALAAAPAVDCPPSNVATLRAALEKIAHYCDNEQGMDDPYCQDGHTCAEIAQAALAAAPAADCPPSNVAALRDALVKLHARFERDTAAWYDHYMKYTHWHWTKKAADAKKWCGVFSSLKDQCAAALATTEGGAA